MFKDVLEVIYSNPQGTKTNVITSLPITIQYPVLPTHYSAMK